MSNKIDPKENVRFLVACINHSNNGKVNIELPELQNCEQCFLLTRE